jgi:hypothetical protein
MNEANLSELKIVVERAVRPVRATMARKRKMREELLAHLLAIFEEEAEKLGDEQTALDMAKRRFGDPKELSRELQASVSHWDRFGSILENLGYQPTESAWHLAAKHFLVMLLIYLLLLPMWLAFRDLRYLRELRDMGPMEVQRGILIIVGAVVVAALFNVILSIVLAPLLHKIGPVLASKRWGRILLAVLCGFVVLCGAVPTFTGAAILFLLMARQAVKEWRYQADWA